MRTIRTVNTITSTRTRTRADLSMNMFNRFARVVSSNVNNLIKGLEDPEKVIEQAVIDMQSDLVKIRQSYAEISATQKRMDKQREQADGMANDWYRRAQLALEKGDEELAREALSRRQIQLDIVEDLNKQIALQAKSIEKLYTSMVALEQKITEAKRQKDTFIARARTAKTASQVNDMLSSITGTSSMEAFERMKAKVENLEAEAEVAGELAASSSGSASPNMEERFRALEGNSKVEDQLEMMKKRLPGSQKETPQLPPIEVRTQMDAEYERLKKEFGK